MQMMLIYRGQSVHSIKKITAVILVASKKNRIEENADKSNYMVMSRVQNAEMSQY